MKRFRDRKNTVIELTDLKPPLANIVRVRVDRRILGSSIPLSSIATGEFYQANWQK